MDIAHFRFSFADPGLSTIKSSMMILSSLFQKYSTRTSIIAGSPLKDAAGRAGKAGLEFLSF